MGGTGAVVVPGRVLRREHQLGARGGGLLALHRHSAGGRLEGVVEHVHVAADNTTPTHYTLTHSLSASLV